MPVQIGPDDLLRVGPVDFMARAMLLTQARSWGLTKHTRIGKNVSLQIFTLAYFIAMANQNAMASMSILLPGIAGHVHV